MALRTAIWAGKNWRKLSFLHYDGLRNVAEFKGRQRVSDYAQGKIVTGITTAAYMDDAPFALANRRQIAKDYPS